MAESANIVIDASIALAWLLPDEVASPWANQLYERSISENLMLSAPVLLLYEVLNGIRSSVLRKRIDQRGAKKAIDRFNDLGIALENQIDQQNQVVRLALDLGLSVYDAAYIALARQKNATLYTTDMKLAKKVGSIVSVKTL